MAKTVKLPCPFNMAEMYRKYSVLFPGPMPEIEFHYKVMKRKLGYAKWIDGKPVSITMSSLWDFSEYEFREIFLHEMCHIYLFSIGKIRHGHRRLFRETAQNIIERAREVFGEVYEQMPKATYKLSPSTLFTRNGSKKVGVIQHGTKKEYFAFISAKDYRKHHKTLKSNGHRCRMIVTNGHKWTKISKNPAMPIYAKMPEGTVVHYERELAK